MYLLKTKHQRGIKPDPTLHNGSQVLRVCAQLAWLLEFTASNHVHFEIKLLLINSLPTDYM